MPLREGTPSASAPTAVGIAGNQAGVVYDFVTSTPVGPVLSVEHLRLGNGRIASTVLVFERLHWPEVMAVIKEREEKAAAVPA